MKQLFGEYLKEKNTKQGVCFYWHQLNVIGIILFFLTALMIFVGIKEFLGQNEFGETHIPPFSNYFRIIYWTLIFIILLLLLFNRKSVLEIRGCEVYFKKTPLSLRKKKFMLSDINQIESKIQHDIAESETGISREIYNLYIHLNNGKKIKIGSFGKSDCDRLKKAMCK